VFRSMLAPVLALTLVSAAACKNATAPVGPSAPYSATDLRVGTGADAVNGRRVTVNYTGWLYSTTGTENKGKQFDTSVGGPPFTFTLGAGQVISGWDKGVVGMKVGGLRRLILPPELGYGSSGSGPAIPGNASLIFDIELLSVQ
jgi:FKBP-type peptidyl-prolyl cis-trans isomerase FkpA